MFSQEDEYNYDFIEYTFENNSIYTSKVIHTNLKQSPRFWEFKICLQKVSFSLHTSHNTEDSAYKLLLEFWEALKNL